MKLFNIKLFLLVGVIHKSVAVKLCYILLIVQKCQTTTVWMYRLKPCKEWDKLPTSTGDRRISEPSTVLYIPLKHHIINSWTTFILSHLKRCLKTTGFLTSGNLVLLSGFQNGKPENIEMNSVEYGNPL